MNHRERFLAVMDHRPPPAVPNWELGVWGQTRDRWLKEGLREEEVIWDWFRGDPYWGMDLREFVNVQMGMQPSFPTEVLESTDRYEIIRHANGVVTKALIQGMAGGTRASMDQYIRFPVHTLDDFESLKKRYVPDLSARYPQNWESRIQNWNKRDHVLILGVNCCIGFYGIARQWMGTEGLSLAFYDQPRLCHAIFEFIADFFIELTGPILRRVQFDYFNFFEDLAYKTAPLLSPDVFKRFIFPHYRRAIDHLRSHGVPHISLDSDGNTELLLPLFLEMGVDVHWPFERAAGMDPVRIKREYGSDLRIWGGVDKRDLAQGQGKIDEALRALSPLIEEGGYIPTVDHTVPPDVSLDHFRYYMERKALLLEGRL